MIDPRLFLCSGVTLAENDPRLRGRRIVPLDAIGPNSNVNIRLESVAQAFCNQLQPRLIDLLEIVSYVYSADASTNRGRAWTDGYSKEPWERDFKFIIPVRDLGFWKANEVLESLVEIVQFLSNDKVEFEFVQLHQSRPIQEYLQFGDPWELAETEFVTMFSGGLDSLSGVLTQANSGERLVLVSHSPVSTILKRQRELFTTIKNKFSNPMIHIPVWINKHTRLGREHTQRTRSLLYAALGTLVGASLNAKGLLFYENGVVSLNLPVADEVLRARASRTTHPTSLKSLSVLMSLILGREFQLENPFLFKTKTEVVAAIDKNNCADMIAKTSSCAHTMFQTRTQWHCGACSQCIDRRISVVANGLECHDRDSDYVSDVFLGSRKDGYDRNMAVDYIRHAFELHNMSESQIESRFNLEFSRAARGSKDKVWAIEEFINMHKRHGATVQNVITNQIKSNAQNIANGKLDKFSLLGLVTGQTHLESTWTRYANRVCELLRNGIPRAVRSNKPKNEPHLQEICDGILMAHDNDLVREFPFMRWSSGATKPDWSKDDLNFWVELKYVRQKSDLAPIREAIAADITKYGDNNRRVLFIIYDPNGLIVDFDEFAHPLTKRDTMKMVVLR